MKCDKYTVVIWYWIDFGSIYMYVYIWLEYGDIICLNID